MDGNFTNIVTPEYAVLLPVMWILGYFIKKSPIPNWAIPWLIMVVSVILCGALKGFTINSIIQGVLVASTAVFGNQLLKQTIDQG